MFFVRTKSGVLPDGQNPVTGKETMILTKMHTNRWQKGRPYPSEEQPRDAILTCSTIADDQLANFKM